ncbi:MAG: glucoamylase family protein [bacterium]
MIKKVFYLSIVISLIVWVRCAFTCAAHQDTTTTGESHGFIRQTRPTLRPLPDNPDSWITFLDRGEPCRALDFHTFIDPNTWSDRSFERWPGGEAAGYLGYMKEALDKIRAAFRPKAPETISVLACDQAVIINWSQNAQMCIFPGYNIYRADRADGLFSKVNKQKIKSHGYVDTSLENGKTYFYKIGAVNLFHREGPFSPIVSVRPQRPEADDEFLEMVSRAAFHYFWYEANPHSGLIPCRMSQPDVAACGVVGYGLAAIVIGSHRGWISREEAADRVYKTLDFLDKNVDKFDGFFRSCLDAETGKAKSPGQNGNSDQHEGGKVDIWENSLLFAGMLVCREYFNGDQDLERNIRSLAEQLYKEARWDKVLVDNGYTLARQWTPDTENKPASYENTITGYGEAMLAYILAIASPTHGIDPICYEKGWTRGYTPREGAYGIDLDVGQVTAPISQHHHSHCWLDYRGKWDAYTNYFDNARNGILINRQYCIENPRGWTGGYGENMWGLTSSDSPDGYGTWAPFTRDNGTIAPAAAGGSIPFTPEYAIQTLRYLYDHHRGILWGIYGFFDAFNPSRTPAWASCDYLGMNEGPLVLMIENFRSSFLWDIIAQNEWIDLAMGKIFTGDHEEAPDIQLTSPYADPSMKGIRGKFVPIRWECHNSHREEDTISLQYSYNHPGNQFLIDDFEHNTPTQNSLGYDTFFWGCSGDNLEYACGDSNSNYQFQYQVNTSCLILSYKDNPAPKGYGTRLEGLDASAYDELTFLVKGVTGKEQFHVSLTDTDQRQLKLLAHAFLPEGKVTRNWQRLILPLDRFKERSSAVDLTRLANFSLDFGDCSGKGTVCIDEIRFITWSDIASHQPNSGYYQWRIDHIPAQEDHLLIKVEVIDKMGNRDSDQSDHFLFRELQSQSLADLAGEGGGCFMATILTQN